MPLKTIMYEIPSDVTGTPSRFDWYYTYDNSVFIDESTDMNDAGTADVTMAADIDDMFYWGSASFKWDWMRITLSTNGTSGVLVWEYSQGGSNWGTLSVTALSGSVNLVSTGPHALSWTPPSDWATDTVNSQTGYWIRARITTGYTVTPVGSYTHVAFMWQPAQKTLYIPEVTSRTIKSVKLLISLRANGTSNLQIEHQRISVKLGSAALSYIVDLTETITPTGEHFSYVGIVDATSYFVNNFGSGSSQVFNLTGSFSGSVYGTPETIPQCMSQSVIIFITYEYATSNNTRIRTVWIPIESPTGALTASLAEIGTNQIPALDTYLPESTKVYRDVNLVIMCNDRGYSTTDYRLCVSLDSDSEYQFGLHEMALSTSVYGMWIKDMSTMTTNAVHALKARVTSTSGGDFRWFTAFLVVTYEYDHASSSSVMNSIFLPVDFDRTLYFTTSADQQVTRLEFNIEESNPSLSKAGLLLGFDAGVSIGTLSVQVNSASARTYTHIAPSNVAGGFNLIHSAASGILLVRGKNIVDFKIFGNTVDVGSNIWGMFVLNYVSSKHASGDNVHNHTVFFGLYDFEADAFRREIASLGFDITETEYFINGLGAWFFLNSDDALYVDTLYAERLSGEGPADGWENFGTVVVSSSAELGWRYLLYDLRKYFKRWVGDPDTNRLNIETARKWSLRASDSQWFSAFMIVTYHAITYSISRTCSGYAGDGSGIKVELCQVDSDGRIVEKVLEATTSAGGSYSATWYDDVTKLCAVARESDTKIGRSANAIAG